MIREFDDSHADTQGNDTENRRVLLLSRKEVIRDSLSAYFKETNLLLTVTDNPQDALRRLKKNPFDAIITEAGEGDDSGLAFREMVRQQGDRTPMVFLAPVKYWSDLNLLNRIAEDGTSCCIPESAGARILIGKLRQVINASNAVNSLAQLKVKIERDEFLASQLQLAMLPPWVHFCDSYEFSCLYQPYSGVSGDLFEWMPLDDSRALFIFGDVSGHGTHSALAMTAVQSFLKQTILLDKEKATRPDQIASEINDFFCNHLQNIVYMCTMIAYFDFGKNYLCYQNAGYLDITCVNAKTGEIEELNPENRGNLPLGMVRGTVYSAKDNVEYHFTDDSVFLFHSDGLIDLSKDPDGEIPLDTVMCRKLSRFLVMDGQKEEKSVAIPFRAYHKLKQYGYIHPQDDLSMILIRKPLHLDREYVFSCRVPADEKAVDAICERASDFVTECYHDEELSVDTELLLEEYLINIIMHGLTEYEKLNEYIAVKLCAYPDELKLIIWDHGKEWDGLLMPPDAAEEELDRLNEEMSGSGRGLPIINKIASRMNRERYCDLNETMFNIPRRRRDRESGRPEVRK